MYLRVDVTQSSPLQLLEVDDFERFKVVVLGALDDDALAVALAPYGALLPGGDVLVRIDAVKALAGDLTSELAWLQQLDAMVHVARRRGWSDCDGSSIRAHCERH